MKPTEKPHTICVGCRAAYDGRPPCICEWSTQHGIAPPPDVRYLLSEVARLTAAVEARDSRTPAENDAGSYACIYCGCPDRAGHFAGCPYLTHPVKP